MNFHSIIQFAPLILILIFFKFRSIKRKDSIDNSQMQKLPVVIDKGQSETPENLNLMPSKAPTVMLLICFFPFMIINSGIMSFALFLIDRQYNNSSAIQGNRVTQTFFCEIQIKKSDSLTHASALSVQRVPLSKIYLTIPIDNAN